MVSQFDTPGLSQEFQLAPDPKQHAGQFAAWIVCWPWDLAWTLLCHNPLRYLLQFAAREVRHTLNEITRSQLRIVEADLLLDPPDDEHGAAPLEAVPPAAVSRSRPASVRFNVEPAAPRNGTDGSSLHSASETQRLQQSSRPAPAPNRPGAPAAVRTGWSPPAINLRQFPLADAPAPRTGERGIQ